MGSDDGGRRRFFSAPTNSSGRGVRFHSDTTATPSTNPASTRNNNSSATSFVGELPFTQLLDTIWGILSACIACWLILGVVTVLVLLSFVVRPFSQATYRRLAATWAATTFLDAISLLLPNCTVVLTGDSDVPSPVGSSVVLANHVTEADWWALFLLGRCVGLKGSLKVFLRNEYLRLNLQDMNGNGEGNGTNHTNGATNNNGNSGMLANGSSSSSTSLANGFNNHTSTSSTNSNDAESTRSSVPDLAVLAKLLHLFLDFPIISEDFAASDGGNREQLFSLLRSFGPTDNVHFLLYPEGWSIHGEDRTHVHQKSNQFAQREGKPALQHLLLPRARGFHASLECLRETAPVVYDVTMAYDRYDGSLPFQRASPLSLATLWDILRRKFPREVHLRIKRYSMEEVLQDSNWLFGIWAEKDRRLSHFARHGAFPCSHRYARLRVFDTRNYTLETAVVALFRLLVVPCVLPLVVLLAIPLVVVVFWILLVQWMYKRWIDPTNEDDVDGTEEGAPGDTSRTPGGSAAAPDTPFLPTTPFVSPSPFAWRDMFQTPGSSSNVRSRG